jgi:hypothetical protein
VLLEANAICEDENVNSTSTFLRIVIAGATHEAALYWWEASPFLGVTPNDRMSS